MASDPPFEQSYNHLFEALGEDRKAKQVHPETNSFANNEIYELPLIDLNRLSLTKSDQDECKREIADAAKQLGFFQVVNHGVSREIITRLQSEQAKLFKHPFREKASERLLDSSMGSYHWGTPSATFLMQFSWSEAFHIPLTGISGLNGFDNVRSPIEEFAEVVGKLAQRIAKILAENIGCESNFFAENCLPSSCYLRLNRYPPCPKSSKLFGLVPHTDSDFLTILYQDLVGGLQLVRDGGWISVKPNPDALIINIGDLFQAWSNGVYKSIEHRVVTNPRVERFSAAYFLCPSNDTIIHSCNQPSVYRSFSFEEYRKQVQEDVKSTGTKIGLPRFIIK
ncbi:gibberellin 2-beta-dioxygenase 8-like isoform X1 [Actinidia eriantha]|uniref:gibberellin 2-beta-dioxygenase 8-like isoform X1 n=1 Tax=Actinidia eriantha TaxID=165200 RepID=UPI00258DFDF7|nr:gibberellin 2-beta-dioxygenase 8-like isoform X1 [Actinidia eriantha]